MDLESITKKIIKWGEDRNIDNPVSQLVKTTEEFGELIEAVDGAKYGNFEKNRSALIDAIGDTYVTVVIGANIAGVEYKAPEPIKKDGEVYPEAEYSELELIFIAGRIGKIAKCVAHDKMDKVIIKNCIDEILWSLDTVAGMFNLDLVDCVAYAYKEISDRKGKTINGNFIKEQ